MTMCVENTPVEDYTSEFGLYTKREDLCCPGGPDFSKTRGVFKHIQARPERYIGVLDTAHSQGGHAVARACKLLGKQCVNFYAVRKAEQGALLKPQQQAAAQLGAHMIPMAATMSSVLHNVVRSRLSQQYEDWYMMPNALKLRESVSETAREVDRTTFPRDIDAVLVSASSATIAAGVILGLVDTQVEIVIHLGYSRSEADVRRYLDKMAFEGAGGGVKIVDEGYAYKDAARPGVTPPFPCNSYYDLKAFRYWMRTGRAKYGKALFWNIG